ALPAYLDDYAFLVYGLMNLYEASFKVEYLALADGLTRQTFDLFWDGQHSVFNFSGQGNEELLAPSREFYDGALPAGNSVAFHNLLKLARITTDNKYLAMAEKMATRIMVDAEEYPPGYTMFLSGIDFMLGPTGEIVIAGKIGASETAAARKIIHEKFSPHKVVLLHPPGSEGEKLEKLAEYTKYQQMIEGKTTFYLCRNYACEKPLTGLGELQKQMKDFP
ncbi:MAG: thioredoxin domain-containing protein, partial [Thermodesulfobacteriota bacterium]